MHRLLETIYAASPPAVRTVFASAYGWKLYRERYGGRFARYAAALAERERATPEALAAYQREQLRALVRHACHAVPFYAERFARAGLRPDDVREVADLAALPLLDKETVRNAGDRLLASTIAPDAHVVVNTSGTTGTTLRIVVDREGRRQNYAFFERAKRWAGIEGFPRSATFGGRVVVPQAQSRPPYWVSNWATHNTQLSSFHLSPDTAAAYARKLCVLRPAFIHSYPSSVYTLATCAHEQGLELPQPRCIMTSSETVFPNMRAAIEAAFACKVFDQYGGAEQVAFASECGAGGLHAHPDFGLVEILNDAGEPCAPGEPGEIVATGFTNRAMPLVRYRTGDSACWSADACPCGRPFPVIAELLGRTDDLLIAPDGRFVGRLDPVFKGLTSVRAAQIAQTAADRVEVRTVRGSEYTPEHEAVIRRELQQRLGEAMHIEFRYVEHIPRTSAGKFRAVVREMPPSVPAEARSGV